MKKFLASVFILLVFGGVVFYIGWTQFKVKADYIGVVISKTNGIDKIPVENGKFSWHKEFLLPTNATIKLFSIKPVNVNKTVSGELPSGSVYSAIFNSNDNFSYSFDFSISVTLAPEKIPELLQDNKISNDEDLQQYLEKACDTIAQLSADYILKKVSENPMFRSESIRRDDILRSIQIYKEFPEIDITAFAISNTKLPDYVLYKKIQEQFLSGQGIQNIESDNQNNLEFSSLEGYNE